LLGEAPVEHHFIVTVPGRGYRFIADVRSVERFTFEKFKVTL
jgi:DNA-binding winged helix-turn-helix (wHTH) protein